MYNGLEYIEEKFPHFFDFSENSNNRKISHVIHHNFKELYNSLEAVRNSYYFLEDANNGNLNFTEHLSIETLTDSYNIIVSAPDIKQIRIHDLNDKTEKTINFDLREHKNKYNLEITPITHDYKVVAETWEEYTYTSYSNQINPDLDIIAKLVGCSRRNYKEI